MARPTFFAFACALIFACPAQEQVFAQGNEKPSFDCGSAKRQAARLICSDNELAKIERDLSEQFKHRLDPLRGADRDTFIADQRKWINERNARCGLTGKDNEPIQNPTAAKKCMADEMKKRTALLYGVLLDLGDSDVQPDPKASPPKPPLKKNPAAKKPIDLSAVTQFLNISALQWQFGACDGSSRQVFIYLRPEEEPQLLDKRFVEQASVYYAKKAASQCPSMFPSPINIFFNRDQTNLASTKVDAVTFEVFLDFNQPAADRDNAQRQFEIEQDKKREETIRAVAQMQAEREKARAAKIRTERRSQFVATYGVQAWVNETAISTNPFVYKDQIIGIVTTFNRMISANEALCGYRANLVLSDVPPTQFTVKDQFFLISAKVKGMKGGVPELQLLGAVPCSDHRCTEYFDP